MWALSDDFSNFRMFRSVAWMRLTWLAGTGRGLDNVLSLHPAVREGACSAPWPGASGGLYRPVIALSLLACSGTAYAAQPFVDHSNPDLDGDVLL